MIQQCAHCNKRLRDGFVFVSPTSSSSSSFEEEEEGTRFYSNDVHRKSQLFELATKSEGWESYPHICAKCTSDLVAYLDELIVETEACNTSYIKFMTDVDFDPPTAPMAFQANLHSFDKIIQGLKQRHDSQLQVLTDLQCERITLEHEEDRCWSEILYLHTQLQQNTTSDSYANETNNLVEELNQLGSVNVYTNAFVIGVTDYGLGTINNLRLGRKQEEPVDWEEINAAWGQTVLLLSVLAKKLNITFSKYRLIPMGAHAFIQQKELGGVLYPLHGTPAVTFNHTPPPLFYDFWGSSSSSTNNSFDNGLEAFLFCVSELCARVISECDSISIPYYIDKDKIGTSQQALKCIKTAANSEGDWSKATKYMLTNLKRVLVHLSNN